MKSPRAKDPEPDVVDKIVEDLAQQDVLPASADSDVTLATGNSELNAAEQAGSWNEPAGGVGHQAPRRPLEDESKAAEALVERGVNEAAEELQEIEENENPDEEAE